MKRTLIFLTILQTFFSCTKEDNLPGIQSNNYKPELNQYRSAANTPAYYVDATKGNDENIGTSPEMAWKTLDRVHNVTLKPGDVVRLARGSVWENQNILLDNNQAGTQESPIIFEAYGTGEPPTIMHPRALWDKSQPFYGVYITTGSSYINILDIRVQETDLKPGIFMSEKTHHITIAGAEISNCGTGIYISGEYQKIIANYIHDIGSSGIGSGIGITFHGKDLEIAWNQFLNCEVRTEKGSDGAALEFYNYTAAYQYNYLSDNIKLHHNTIDNCYVFMELYGNVTRMQIAYNLYINSINGALQIHFDDSEHATWTHECTYEISVENNTFVPRMDQNPSGWGIVGQLIDFDHKPDPAKSKIVLRNNIFMSNYRITTSNQLGANFIHDHNLYYFVDGGKPGDFELADNEIIADPLFVSYANQDFRLATGSPAINAGATSSFQTDILGNTVPNEGVPDIGAYEK